MYCLYSFCLHSHFISILSLFIGSLDAIVSLFVMLMHSLDVCDCIVGKNLQSHWYLRAAQERLYTLHFNKEADFQSFHIMFSLRSLHFFLLLSTCFLLFLTFFPSTVQARSDLYCGRADCYEILGVKQDATQSQIKKTFYKLSLEL